MGTKAPLRGPQGRLRSDRDREQAAEKQGRERHKNRDLR